MNSNLVSHSLRSVQCIFFPELRRTRRDVLEQIVEEELGENQEVPKLKMPNDFPDSDDDHAGGTLTAILLETTNFSFLKVHPNPTPHCSILWPFLGKNGKPANATAKAEESDDDFDSDEGAEEQVKMLKDVKFPEVENVSKMPSSCPKVSTCLQKRVNGLDDIVKKFDASETALNETQKTFPNLNSLCCETRYVVFWFLLL